MQQIYPLSHQTIYPLIGKKICAVTHDGTHYYGKVSEVVGGRVLLTDCTIGDGASTHSAANVSKTKNTNSKKKTKLSGYYDYGYGYGYGYGYEAYWLDLALITTLFLLPFFCIWLFDFYRVHEGIDWTLLLSESGRHMGSKRRLKNKGITPKDARRCIGLPVCVILNDGNYYMGMVSGIVKGELILSDPKPLGRVSPAVRSKDQVQVSGFLQSLLGLGGASNMPASNAFGAINPFAAGPVGGGLANAVPGGGAFFGMFKQMWPTVSFGLQMVKSITPLMGLFKIWWPAHPSGTKLLSPIISYRQVYGGCMQPATERILFRPT
jgi:hypothetical protein